MKQPATSQLDRFIADAVLGIDTLWGGDVMCASGTGRFIADSWFSDAPLPASYKHPAAALLRASGGVGGKAIDHDAVETYLRAVDLPAAIAGLRKEAAGCPALRRAYLVGLADSLDVMWALAMEACGKGDPVPYQSLRIPKPSASASPNCSPAPATPLRKPVVFSPPSTHGVVSASHPWPR
jgi:hypothetical protein